MQCTRSTPCENPEMEGVHLESNVTLVADRFLQVSSVWDGFCGGAYPLNHEHERNVYDLDDKGRAVSFADLFDRYPEVEKQINELFRRNADDLKATGVPEETIRACGDRETSGFVLDSSARQLVAYGNYPHVAAVCSELPPAAVDISKLEPYLSELGRAYLAP